MFSPFNNANYNKFVNNVRANNWNYFVMVKDPKTGKTICQGDKKMALEFLTSDKAKERRESGAWVPTTPLPKLPQPMGKLVENVGEVRKFASQLVTKLMEPKQRLGQVINIRNNLI